VEGRHRIEQRSPLEEHAELAPNAAQLLVGDLVDVDVINDDAATIGFEQADDVFHEHALARARPTDDGERLPLVDVERDVVENDLVLEAFVYVIDYDHGSRMLELEEHHGQNQISNQDEHATRDGCLRGALADALCASRGKVPLVARDRRYQEPEDDGLDQAEYGVKRPEKVTRALHKLTRRQVVAQVGDQQAVADAYEAGRHVDYRKHENAGQLTRRDELAHRIVGHRFERVDLLGQPLGC